MDIVQFISSARSFSELGESMMKQLESVVQGGELEEQNSNALKYILDFLRTLDSDIEGVEETISEIDEYLNEDPDGVEHPEQSDEGPRGYHYEHKENG